MKTLTSHPNDDNETPTFRMQVLSAFEGAFSLSPSEEPLVGNDIPLKEYLVAHMGSSFFDKKKEQAKKELLKINKVQHIVDNGKREVYQLGQTQRYIALSGRKYCLDLQIRVGASLLDQDKLRGLLRHRGLKSDEVDSIIEESKVKQQPAVIFGVSDK